LGLLYSLSLWLKPSKAPQAISPRASVDIGFIFFDQLITPSLKGDWKGFPELQRRLGFNNYSNFRVINAHLFFKLLGLQSMHRKGLAIIEFLAGKITGTSFGTGGILTHD